MATLMSIPIEIVGRSQDISDWIVIGAAVAQAVGSVAAILAAIWVTNHDRAETRRAQRDKQISALASVLFKAEGTLRGPYEKMTAEPPARFGEVFAGEAWEANLRNLQRCQRIIGGIPVHELEWELASAVMEMEDALAVGIVELNTIHAGNRAALVYPDMAHVDVSGLRGPVNAAAAASARIHQLAHSNSRNRKVRKYRIGPATV